MMRFPRPTLDIDAYLQVIEDLLKDEECHLFIDTNIISQLYKLNDDARKDFYYWVSFVGERFHIPKRGEELAVSAILRLSPFQRLEKDLG